MSRLLAVISKERCTQRHMGRESAQLSLVGTFMTPNQGGSIGPICSKNLESNS